MGENKKRHILICGERGVGKSTLIARLLAQTDIKTYGFYTKKLNSDENGFHPIYIHAAAVPLAARKFTAENLIGTCDTKTHNINIDVFNTLGVKYITAAKNDGVIIMDEIGFMEAQAENFTRAVFNVLDGNIPAIVAVKARFDVPFLNKIRAHDNAKLFMLTRDNRDEVFLELLKQLRI